MLRRFPLLLSALLAGLAASASALAAGVPFWGARQSSPVDTAPDTLKPGQWLWAGDSKTMGPMAVVVSLTEQRAYVYRNGLRIGVAMVSSGRKGYETPIGVFTILQKDKDHHSNVYDNAPMPYQQRLTWSGVALHAGGIPGYPESHGCVHLPTAFAEKLFAASTMGMTVVVSAAGDSPVELVHPGPLSPIDPSTGATVDLLLEDGRPWRWEPERAPTPGLVSIVLSRSDRILFVYRDGREIGRSRIDVKGDGASGTRAWIVAAGYVPPKDATATAKAPMPSWIRIGLPGDEADAGQALSAASIARISVPDAFREQVMPLLVPGTVLVSTDAHVLPQSTGASLQVIDSDPPDTPR